MVSTTGLCGNAFISLGFLLFGLTVKNITFRVSKMPLNPRHPTVGY